MIHDLHVRSLLDTYDMIHIKELTTSDVKKQHPRQTVPEGQEGTILSSDGRHDSLYMTELCRHSSDMDYVIEWSIKMIVRKAFFVIGSSLKSYSIARHITG